MIIIKKCAFGTKKIKFNWAGHSTRHKNARRWPKLIERWEPTGKRKRVRPETRWADKIELIAGRIFWRKKIKI